jgi:hypothetical protein
MGCGYQEVFIANPYEEAGAEENRPLVVVVDIQRNAEPRKDVDSIS